MIYKFWSDLNISVFYLECKIGIGIFWSMLLIIIVFCKLDVFDYKKEGYLNVSLIINICFEVL